MQGGLRPLTEISTSKITIIVETTRIWVVFIIPQKYFENASDIQVWQAHNTDKVY